MSKAQFGMIGLAVMGSNLALNVEEHGFPVAVWNREPQVVDDLRFAVPDRDRKAMLLDVEGEVAAHHREADHPELRLAHAFLRVIPSEARDPLPREILRRLRGSG